MPPAAFTQPQYRIRDIESGHIRQIQPTVFRAYIRLPGLSGWFAEWRRENPELAKRLAGSGGG